jgi:hypothetical protein
MYTKRPVALEIGYSSCIVGVSVARLDSSWLNTIEEHDRSLTRVPLMGARIRDMPFPKHERRLEPWQQLMIWIVVGEISAFARLVWVRLVTRWKRCAEVYISRMQRSYSRRRDMSTALAAEIGSTYLTMAFWGRNSYIVSSLNGSSRLYIGRHDRARGGGRDLRLILLSIPISILIVGL